MTTMKVDDGEIRRLEKALEGLSKKGIPFAIRAALNAAAYDAYGRARNEVRKRFILRNNYTIRSIVYDKVPQSERRVNHMRSAVGSLQEYMGRQDEGFTRRSSGHHGYPVPTGEAAGTPNAKPRRKVLRKKNYLGNIEIKKPPRLTRKMTSAQQTVAVVREGVVSGKRVVAWRFGKTFGLWRLQGGRKAKSGWPKGVRIRLLYGMSKKTLRIKSNPWLKVSASRAASEIPDAYAKELKRQIEALLKARATSAATKAGPSA